MKACQGGRNAQEWAQGTRKWCNQDHNSSMSTTTSFCQNTTRVNQNAFSQHISRQLARCREWSVLMQCIKRQEISRRHHSSMQHFITKRQINLVSCRTRWPNMNKHVDNLAEHCYEKLMVIRANTAALLTLWLWNASLPTSTWGRSLKLATLQLPLYWHWQVVTPNMNSLCKWKERHRGVTLDWSLANHRVHIDRH